MTEPRRTSSLDNAERSVKCIPDEGRLSLSPYHLKESRTTSSVALRSITASLQVAGAVNSTEEAPRLVFLLETGGNCCGCARDLLPGASVPCSVPSAQLPGSRSDTLPRALTGRKPCSPFQAVSDIEGQCLCQRPSSTSDPMTTLPLSSQSVGLDPTTLGVLLGAPYPGYGEV